MRTYLDYLFELKTLTGGLHLIENQGNPVEWMEEETKGGKHDTNFRGRI
jgi:hypothetical protein